jgi:hypothetical protein
VCIGSSARGGEFHRDFGDTEVATSIRCWTRRAISDYETTGAAFIFADRESGRVTTIPGYPTQQIFDEISGVFRDDGSREW